MDECLSTLAFLLVLEPLMLSWTLEPSGRKLRKMTGGKDVQVFVGSEMKQLGGWTLLWCRWC